jgi:hypothetical protein
MTDRPSAPQPVAPDISETFSSVQVKLSIEQFLQYGEEQFLKSQRGYFSGNGWAARCLRFHLQELKGNANQAALDAAVAAARADERRQFIALCERAVRDFVNPGSELPYDHGFVTACNLLKQAAIRAATPQEPT